MRSHSGNSSPARRQNQDEGRGWVPARVPSTRSRAVTRTEEGRRRGLPSHRPLRRKSARGATRVHLARVVTSTLRPKVDSPRRPLSQTVPSAPEAVL